jgi:hypothetical protein
MPWLSQMSCTACRYPSLRHDHAALALYRLEHDGAGRLVDGGFHGRGVVVGHVSEGGRHGLEGGVVLFLSCRRERGERAPVERVLRRDDLVAFLTLFVEVFARELDGALVRLRARVGEENAVGAAVGYEGLREPGLRPDIIKVGGVYEPCALFLHGRGETRVRVPQHVHGDPREKVDVRLAFGVKKRAALARIEGDGEAGPEGVHEITGVEFLDFLQFFHAIRPPYRSLVTIVPMPLSVNISSTMGCGIVPLRMCVRFTPFLIAWMQPSTLGIMPPSIIPDSMAS